MRTFAHVGMPFKRKALLFGQFSQPFDELITFHNCDNRTKISECQDVRRRAEGTRWCVLTISVGFILRCPVYRFNNIGIIDSCFHFLCVSVVVDCFSCSSGLSRNFGNKNPTPARARTGCEVSVQLSGARLIPDTQLAMMQS